MATIPRLPARPRSIVRAVHVLASIGWVGLVVVMLVLGLAATTAGDGTIPIYLRLMEQVGTTIIPIFAVATLLTGLILSVATPWGLIRHWWVVVKLVLTVAVIVTAVALTETWIQQAIDHTTAPARWLLLGGSVVHLLMLASATVISVDKPWGKTRRGRRPTPDRRRTGPRRPEIVAAQGAGQ